LARALFFLLNGVSVLLAETVWLKQHVLLFGAQPAAYASILTAYFLGTAIGARSFRSFDVTGPKRPWLVLAFAGALALSFWGPSFFFDLGWELLANNFGGPVYDGLRWFVALACVLPACVAWGAFLPLAARGISGKRFIVLYGLQTFGSGLGILAGSFFLPYGIGYRATTLVAIAVNLLSLVPLFQGPARDDETAKPAESPLAFRHAALAFWGGALALVLEILFIRFVAVGTDNTIYAFGAASLSVVVLLTLASWVTPRLPASWFKRDAALHWALLLAPFGVLASVAWVKSQTHDLRIEGMLNAAGFSRAFEYSAALAGLGFLVPAFLFPMLVRSLKLKSTPATPADIGRLLSWNALGCAAGAFWAATLGIPSLGMWGIATASMAAYWLLSWLFQRSAVRNVAAAGCVLVIALMNPLSEPLSTLDAESLRAGGNIVAADEGDYGIVSVVDRNGSHSLWLNNTYQLEAGTANVESTRRMGILASALRPEAKRLLMVGLGTGITASGFAFAPLERIELVELVPEVHSFAQRYFAEYNQHVLSRPNVVAHVADGRQFLRLGRQHYDVIVGDLFTPWHDGTAYLYTREHFDTVKRRLTDSGIFVLWLPAFQLSARDFFAIARTFNDAFPDATAWQLEISTDSAAIGLVGCKRASGPQFDVAAIERGLAQRAANSERTLDIVERHPSGLFSRYLGPLAALPGLENAPLITTDRPVLERMAAESGRALLTGERFLALIAELMRARANPKDRIFSHWDQEHETWRQSGFVLNQYWLARSRSDQSRADTLLERAFEMNPAAKASR
jgi:spermidine synthase